MVVARLMWDMLLVLSALVQAGLPSRSYPHYAHAGLLLRWRTASSAPRAARCGPPAKGRAHGQRFIYW